MGSLTDWASLRARLGRSDAEVRYACRVGSHVYGTARPGSDEDFVVVLRGAHPRDLLLGPRINVTLQDERTFADALGGQSLFALEAHFAPPSHRLHEGAPLAWRLVPPALRQAVNERALADLEKGLRTLPHEPDRARKRLFHALRVATFGGQLLGDGRITDFTAANRWFLEILTEPSEGPEDHAARWRPALRALLDGL